MSQNNQKDVLMENLAKNREAIKASRYRKSGETGKSSKLSSKNFDKLMEKRGLPKADSKEVKASFDRSSQMEARHAKAGDNST